MPTSNENLTKNAPYESTEFLTEEQLQVFRDVAKPGNPYESTEFIDLPATKAPGFNLLIPDEERYKHPYITAARETAFYTATEIMPWGKYLRKDDWEEFENLNLQEQVNSMLWETFGGVIWMFGGELLKDIGYIVKGGSRAGITSFDLAAKKVKLLKPKPAMKPVEDLTIWEGWDESKALYDVLRKQGMTKSERVAIDKAIKKGDPEELVGMLEDTSIRHSKAFAKGVKKKGKDFELSQELQEAIAIPELRKTFAKQAFLETTKSNQIFGVTKTYINKKTGKTFSRKVYAFKSAPEAAYKAMAERFYGYEKATASDVTLANASVDEMLNFANYMLEAPGQAALAKVARTPFFTLIRPIRNVFGKLDLYYGTYDNIYERTQSFMRNTNTYTAKKIADFKAMLTQRGLMSVKHKTKGGRDVLKFTRHFTKKEAADANKIIVDMDNIRSKAVAAGTKEAVAEAKIAIEELRAIVTPKIRNMVDAHVDYMDYLYGEEAIYSIQEIIRRQGLTRYGEAIFERIFERVSPTIQQTFSTASSLPYDQKVMKMKSIFKSIVDSIESRKASGLFKPVRDIEAVMDDITKSLTFESDGGRFINYLENYASRTASREATVLGQLMPGRMPAIGKASYSKIRSKVIRETEPRTLEETIQYRTHAQSRRMFMRDEFNTAVQYAKTLPDPVKNFVDHYYSRLLGLPSQADIGVAAFLNSVVGPVERVFGGAGIWDEARVLRLGKSINNITYMGFLGFKPFTGIRNLTQPLITVPGDLGGIKDIPLLGRAFKKMVLDKKVIKELSDMGIIGEPLPEISINKGLFNFGKTVKLRGKEYELWSMDDIKDTALWFVTSTDKLNRYWTGTAAMIKFDETLAVEGAKGIRKLISGRHEYIQTRMLKLIKDNNMPRLRTEFIKDVVGDTQYIYGALDSPIISQQWGIAGRTGIIFQSWWMNYGKLLAKWTTTGETTLKFRRLTNTLISSAMVYTTMANIWDERVAASTVLLGPFPSGAQPPPAWRPVYEIIKGIINIGEADTKTAARIANMTFDFVPGGVAIKGLARGAARGGLPGFGKAVVGIKTPK